MDWKIKIEEIDLKNISSKKYHPVVLELLKTRGITSSEDVENFFEFDYDKNLGDPLAILQMEKTVERVMTAKKNQEKIAIFGDYDADGVTASVVLREALEELGLPDIICYIPDRQLEGYGMNEKAINYLHGQKIKLIITVDCGITGIKEVQKAKDLGMDVIITDHHRVPQNLPDAFSIINPNIENSGFKCQDLAGVGVAYKLAQALYKKMAPEKIEKLKWALDLVAIGTIADCVPLLGENRVLVKYGLIVLSKTRRVGLNEMFKVGRITIDENNPPDTHRVAFQIAPRINAAGRMDHANVSYNLLGEKDVVRARELALEVEGKNQERQKVTGEIVREVQIIAENSFRDKKYILAANPHWPVGILGLVAGKICDQFQKPVVICQKQEGEYVGSLRSISQIDIMEVLGECRETLKRFGGHAQAAGITVAKENMEKFYESFEKSLEGKTVDLSVAPMLDVDLEIKTEDINWDLVGELKKMEPFGQGNPEPVFLTRNLIVSELKTVGNGNGHLKMALRGGDNSPKIFDAIGFGFGSRFPDLKKEDKIDIVYNLSEDEWNGNKKMQMKLIDLKIAE